MRQWMTSASPLAGQRGQVPRSNAVGRSNTRKDAPPPPLQLLSTGVTRVRLQGALDISGLPALPTGASPKKTPLRWQRGFGV